MTRRVRRYLAASALVAALVGVSACDGDGEDPQTTGSETTSDETTTDPTTDEVTTDSGPTGEPPEVEEPSAPPEMQVDDATGAAATTDYFLALYDYVRGSGDARLWDALVTDECTWCVTVRDEAQSTYEEGGWIESPGLEFDIASARVRLPEGETDYYTVILDVDEPPFEIVSGDGSTSTSEGQSLRPLGVAVQYIDGGFKVVGVNYEID